MTTPSSDSARSEDSAELAYRTIRDDILTGRIAPGAVLSQVTLAQALGISRTPLREALSRLTSEGLVTSDFNRRVRVSELDLDDLDQIYAARFALEPVGVLATVGRLDGGMRADLATHVEAMDAAIDVRDMDAFRGAHRAFHLGLTVGAGARFERLLADLWDHSERYHLAYLGYDFTSPDAAFDDRLRLSQVEHRSILDAALAGEGDRCADELVAHLTRTLDGVFHEMVRRPAPRVARHAIDRRAHQSASSLAGVEATGSR